MKNILLLSFFLLQSLIAFSQAPNYINYQGAARSSDGTALSTQIINIRISILESAINGTTSYSETFSPITDNNGLFSILIGNGTPVTGTFSSINWVLNSKFLKVEMKVGSSGTYLQMGVSQLVSVPFALHSATTSDPYVLRSTGNLSLTGNLKLINRDQKIIFGSGPTVNDSICSIYRPLLTDGLKLRGNDLYLESNATPIFFMRNNIAKMIFDPGTGKLQVGSDIVPRSAVHVNNGDVYLDNATKGIILTSPNGQCWRVTVDNTGNLIRTSITCP